MSLTHISIQNTKQCEAICFDGDQVIITNEQGELFEYPIEAIIAAKQHLLQLK